MPSSWEEAVDKILYEDGRMDFADTPEPRSRDALGDTPRRTHAENRHRGH